MSAMAAAPPPAARLDTVLSFSDAPAPAVSDDSAATPAAAFSDTGSDTDAEDDASFEFAFAPPLSPRSGGGAALAPADDLFAHGRIVAAYPLFDRHLLVDDHHDDDHHQQQQEQQASTAPPSPDTYCAWAPRSAPGSPSRRDRDDHHPPAASAFPKSSSTGEARRFWRLRDLVAGGGGRSHSDGKEKFVFLQSSDGAKEKHTTAAGTAKAAAPVRKQCKKQHKGGKAAAAAGATEMDMATAHRLFYGKPGATALAGDRPRQQQQQQSFLPYRPGIVGFFASTHAFGRSHHPY